MTSNTNRIILIGGGGHCKSVIDSIICGNEYNDVIITDPNIPAGTLICGCKVVGSDDMLERMFRIGYRQAFISVGSITDTRLRRKIYALSRGIGFDFPTIVDKNAVIAENVDIGGGTFVGKKTVVNSDSIIGVHAIINSGAIIEHECRIGHFTHIAVGAVICGGCNIGNDAFVGANATLVQGIRVGDNSLIGAGSVVLKDVPAGSKIMGEWR